MTLKMDISHVKWSLLEKMKLLVRLFMQHLLILLLKMILQLNSHTNFQKLLQAESNLNLKNKFNFMFPAQKDFVVSLKLNVEQAL